jgi:hypothetical protein
MKWSMTLLLLLLLLFLLLILVRGTRENFEPWSKESLARYWDMQQNLNPRIRMDLNQVQEQASEEEVRAFFRHGKWPWSQDLKRKYILDALDNAIVNQEPNYAMQKAQTIYNETAMRRVLSWLGENKN